MPTISMTLDPASIDKAIRQIEDYYKNLSVKAKQICERLAFPGAVQVSIGFASAIYTGQKDVEVTVEEIKNGYRIVADGETALILEFGAGITYGKGHPQAAEFGMGPGTYPDGKGHWDDPRGWWIPKAKGGGHTYGNPPAMPMFRAAKEMRQNIEQVVREVFAG